MTSTSPNAATDVLKFVGPHANIVVPIGFGEPPTLIDTLEEHAADLDHVRIHQMDPFVERRYIRGEFGDHLRHVSYYLGPGSRRAYWDGHVELVPNHFSEVPMLLRHVVQPSLVLKTDTPLPKVTKRPADPRDKTIAGYIAEMIPDGGCLQVGVGAIPDAVLAELVDHKDLGVHTECLSDGLMNLVERGTVTGARKHHHRNKHVTTFSVGSPELMR